MGKLAQSNWGFGRMQPVVFPPTGNDGRGLMATLRENFAANLKRLLRESSTSQRSFASDVGVTEQTVSKWINRAVFPEDKQLDTVSKVLGVAYEELFKDGGKEITVQVPGADLDMVLRDLAALRGYRLVKKS